MFTFLTFVGGAGNIAQMRATSRTQCDLAEAYRSKKEAYGRGAQAAADEALFSAACMFATGVGLAILAWTWTEGISVGKKRGAE